MKQAETRCWSAEQQSGLSFVATTGRSHTVYLRKAHSLKDISAQIKTLSLLNKLITSERDSLDCSILGLRSGQLGLELTESLCLASACEEKKKLVFYKSWQIFCWPDKRRLYYLCLGFIQAEPAWERRDNDVITTVTLREMYVSILPPCGCQWTLQTNIF